MIKNGAGVCAVCAVAFIRKWSEPYMIDGEGKMYKEVGYRPINDLCKLQNCLGFLLTKSSPDTGDKERERDI